MNRCANLAVMQYYSRMRIGVFDSGIGGEAVAQKLRSLLPDAEIISINDHDHMPYGSRLDADIITLTNTAIQPLLAAECNVIVIACNTVTTVAISSLRTTYPQMKFVGIEPMIKPASEITQTGVIAVCATPGTLGSRRYFELKAEWASQLKVIEPNCWDWAIRIESGQTDAIDIESLVIELEKQSVDVIVLGCTHYHWLKDRIDNVSDGKLTILEPSDAIASRIKDII